MKRIQEAVHHTGTLGLTEEDIITLQALARGSALFCNHMEQFQARWERGDYTEEEQRHVARLTKAYVEFHRALDGGGEDPMLWLGVLALGKFTRASDVFQKPSGFEMVTIHPGSDQDPLNRCPLWPPDAKWCDLCGCYMGPVEDGTRLECSNAFCDSHKERG